MIQILDGERFLDSFKFNCKDSKNTKRKVHIVKNDVKYDSNGKALTDVRFAQAQNYRWMINNHDLAVPGVYVFIQSKKKNFYVGFAKKKVNKEISSYITRCRKELRKECDYIAIMTGDIVDDIHAGYLENGFGNGLNGFLGYTSNTKNLSSLGTLHDEIYKKNVIDESLDFIKIIIKDCISNNIISYSGIKQIAGYNRILYKSTVFGCNFMVEKLPDKFIVLKDGEICGEPPEDRTLIPEGVKIREPLSYRLYPKASKKRQGLKECKFITELGYIPERGYIARVEENMIFCSIKLLIQVCTFADNHTRDILKKII